MRMYDFSMKEVSVFLAVVNLVISFFMGGEWQGFEFFLGLYVGNMLFIGALALIVWLVVMVCRSIFCV